MPRKPGSPPTGTEVPAGRVRYLPSVQSDLTDILRYIARQSGNPAVGRRFVAVLRRQCEHLASLPGTLGTARPELRPDIRSFPYRGYVIFFRYVDDRFEVVHILEGRRDVLAHMRGKENS